MIRLLKWVWNIPDRMKKKYSYRKFREYAECGEMLDLDSNSDCFADPGASIKIGDHCRILGRVLAHDEGNIIRGNNTGIYTRAFVGSVNSICIGSCVIISNHVHIFDHNTHPTSPAARKQMCIDGFDGDAWRWKHAESKPIVIEDNVWIGEYSAVLKGVTIGEGSIVASHSVVTKDVPPHSIVAGNPARVVKKLEHDE